MELGEILKDALLYPLNNIGSMIIYVILSVIVGIVVGSSLVAMVAAIANGQVIATLASGFIGFIVALFVGFIISGYELDIIKYGIERSNDSPRVEPLRQFLNGVKVLVVMLIYYIIPFIIIAVLGIFFQSWVIAVISFILCLIFGLAHVMAQCRLAKTEDLVDALAIGQAIGDISRVGIIRLILFLAIVFVVAFILFLICGFFMNWNSTVGGIILGIVGVYVIFFVARATGLLYSDV